MGKIILHENITPEGFCDHRAFVPDAEMMQFVNDLLKSTDKVIFGRTTFQLFEAYWPSIWQKKEGSVSDIEFAGRIENMEKIVFSKTIKNSSWQNTRILQNLDPLEIKSMKETTARNIIVFGSPNLATQLIRSGLVDEYYFVIQPIIFGRGGRLFKDDELEKYQNLKLVGTKTYDSGAVAIHYQFDH